jgi:hypothetical protein
MMKNFTRKMDVTNNYFKTNEGEIIMNALLSRDAFNEAVVKAIKGYLGEVCDITIKQVVKNNDNVLDALVIHSQEQSMAPSIYLNRFYEEYQEGRSITSIVSEVHAIYEDIKTPAIPFDLSCFTNFEMIKDRILFKLVNCDRNTKLLKRIPHVQFHDLAVIFYIVINSNDAGVSSVTIRNTHMDMWGVNADDVYTYAMLNTPRILPGELMSMQSVLYDMMKNEFMDNMDLCDGEALPDEMMELLLGSLNPDGRDEKMFVLTNSSKMNGAACMLYKGVLSDFATTIGKNLFLLPSSIHEIIIVPVDSNMIAGNLKDMVLDINRTQVAPDEVLSDSVYYFDRISDTITLL